MYLIRRHHLHPPPDADAGLCDVHDPELSCVSSPCDGDDGPCDDHCWQSLLDGLFAAGYLTH